MQSAGWSESTAKPAEPEQAGEEVIRLRPPVKSKATVTAVEEANIKQQGDE
jgi:cytochrome P450